MEKDNLQDFCDITDLKKLPKDVIYNIILKLGKKQDALKYRHYYIKSVYEGLPNFSLLHQYIVSLLHYYMNISNFSKMMYIYNQHELFNNEYRHYFRNIYRKHNSAKCYIEIDIGAIQYLPYYHISLRFSYNYTFDTLSKEDTNFIQGTLQSSQPKWVILDFDNNLTKKILYQKAYGIIDLYELLCLNVQNNKNEGVFLDLFHHLYKLDGYRIKNVFLDQISLYDHTHYFDILQRYYQFDHYYIKKFKKTKYNQLFYFDPFEHKKINLWWSKYFENNQLQKKLYEMFLKTEIDVPTDSSIENSSLQSEDRWNRFELRYYDRCVFPDQI